MRRVERKAGEGSKRRDVLLVRVSRTLRNCDVFVDEFVEARLFEFGSRKTTESCVRTESVMLFCLAYLFKVLFSLEEFSAIVGIPRGRIKILM